MRLLFVLVVLAGACSVSGPSSPPPGGSARAASAGPSSASIGELPQLPVGFPVMPGAVRQAVPAADPGLIALWETDRPGSAAYDFYVAALPAAGYPIVGLYPGGDVALIRLGMPDGSVWQVVTHLAQDGRVAIEVRLDRL